MLYDEEKLTERDDDQTVMETELDEVRVSDTADTFGERLSPEEMDEADSDELITEDEATTDAESEHDKQDVKEQSI